MPSKWQIWPKNSNFLPKFKFPAKISNFFGQIWIPLDQTFDLIPLTGHKTVIWINCILTPHFRPLCPGVIRNAPCTETPVSHSFQEDSFYLSSPLWGNKNWSPQYKDQDGGKISEQNQLNRLQLSNLNTKCTGTPVSHSFQEDSLFLSSPLWGNKELDSPV